MKRHAAILIGILAAATVVSGDPRSDAPRLPTRVPRAELTDAIRHEQGYDRRATTNQSRLQSHVFLRLLRRAAAREPGDAWLFVDYEDWFQAYLEALVLTPEEAPVSVRLSHEHQCDIYLDARPGVVVASVSGAPPPRIAANVRWISRRGTPSYSYRDELSDPVLDLTFAGDVSYRLLEFDHQILFDEIRGVSGRPVTGALALLFKLIGSASARWSRSAIATDGWQLVRGHGRKGPFSRTATVTVQPSGRVEKGVPDDRPDLAALEQRLRRPIEVSYQPWPTH